MFKFRDWIEINKLKIEFLFYNERSIDYFTQNMHLIQWGRFCANENAIELIEKNQDKINMVILSINACAMSILKKRFHEINWKFFCQNYNALSYLILDENLDKISWCHICYNKNPDILPFWEKHLDKLKWTLISQNNNPSAIYLLKKYPQHIDWIHISINDGAIDIIKDNFHILKHNHQLMIDIGKNNQVEKYLIEKIKHNNYRYSDIFKELKIHKNDNII